MAVITFTDKDIWLVARWALKKLFGDIQYKFSVEPDVRFVSSKQLHWMGEIGYKMYREALPELLGYIEKYEVTNGLK